MPTRGLTRRRNRGKNRMKILSLGYVGVSTVSVEDWRRYAGRLLGMQPVDLTAKTRGIPHG